MSRRQKAARPLANHHQATLARVNEHAPATPGGAPVAPPIPSSDVRMRVARSRPPKLEASPRPERLLPHAYQDNPLQSLVEAYALHVIGHLSLEREQASREKIKEMFGPGAEWRATLRRTLAWSADIDATISESWAAIEQRARPHDEAPDALSFARRVADEWTR